METIKNVTQLLVGKAISKTATAGLLINSHSVIADGEICVVDPRTNAQLTTAGYPAGLDAIKLVQRSGSRLIHSDIIRAGTVRKYTISLPANNPATEQSDFVGYNGTSGAITDLIANNIYTLRLYVRGNTTSGFMQQKIKEGFWKSGTTAPTQQAVARGLVDSLIKNYSREPIQDIRFERINSGAQANALGTASATVVRGSNRVVFSENMTALVTAGTILRFGTSGAGTAPVYVVTGVSGSGASAVYTLDIPWQGDTGTIAAANVESVTEGNWGIRIFGIPFAYDGKFYGLPVSWKTNIDFSDNQTTPLTEATGASPGTGTYDVLARIEKELQADEYVYRNFIQGAPVDRADILSTTTYDVITIEYDDVTQSGLGTNIRSPKTLMIAHAITGNQAVVAQIGWLTLLNDLIVTRWATPGATALTPTA